jgi:hypothetical protein
MSKLHDEKVYNRESSKNHSEKSFSKISSHISKIISSPKSISTSEEETNFTTPALICFDDKTYKHSEIKDNENKLLSLVKDACKEKMNNLSSNSNYVNDIFDINFIDYKYEVIRSEYERNKISIVNDYNTYLKDTYKCNCSEEEKIEKKIDKNNQICLDILKQHPSLSKFDTKDILNEPQILTRNMKSTNNNFISYFKYNDYYYSDNDNPYVPTNVILDPDSKKYYEIVELSKILTKENKINAETTRRQKLRKLKRRNKFIGMERRDIKAKRNKKNKILSKSRKILQKKMINNDQIDDDNLNNKKDKINSNAENVEKLNKNKKRFSYKRYLGYNRLRKSNIKEFSFSKKIVDKVFEDLSNSNDRNYLSVFEKFITMKELFNYKCEKCNSFHNENYLCPCFVFTTYIINLLNEEIKVIEKSQIMYEEKCKYIKSFLVKDTEKNTAIEKKKIHKYNNTSIINYRNNNSLRTRLKLRFNELVLQNPNLLSDYFDEVELIIANCNNKHAIEISELTKVANVNVNLLSTNCIKKLINLVESKVNSRLSFNNSILNTLKGSESNCNNDNNINDYNTNIEGSRFIIRSIKETGLFFKDYENDSEE